MNTNMSRLVTCLSLQHPQRLDFLNSNTCFCSQLYGKPKFGMRQFVRKCCEPEIVLLIFRTISGSETQESKNNLMPYNGLGNEIIVPSHKYKPVQRRTKRSESSNQTIPSELESKFRRQKRDTSEETGFKSSLQRLGREVNLTSRLITWPPREVRPVRPLCCLNFEKQNVVAVAACHLFDHHCRCLFCQKYTVVAL